MGTSREGVKRPVPSRNRARGLGKPSWAESTDWRGPQEASLSVLKTPPLTPVGMATAAFSSQTGKLRLSHRLIWEHDRASCRTSGSHPGFVGGRGSVGQGRARHLLPGLTSGARTGKATGIGPGTVRPFWNQLRVARAPVADTATTLPSRWPKQTEADITG